MALLPSAAGFGNVWPPSGFTDFDRFASDSLHEVCKSLTALLRRNYETLPQCQT